MSLRVQYSAVEVVANAVAENKYLSVAEYFAGRSGGLCSRGVRDVCAYVGIVLYETDGITITTTITNTYCPESSFSTIRNQPEFHMVEVNNTMSLPNRTRPIKAFIISRIIHSHICTIACGREKNRTRSQSAKV